MTMDIKQKQHLLAYLGYYDGEVDGKWGQLSETATKAFQKDYGIAADGICGAETEKALKHAVSYGMPAKKEEAATSGDFWDGIKYFMPQKALIKRDLRRRLPMWRVWRLEVQSRQSKICL